METSSWKKIASGVLALVILVGIFAYDALAQTAFPYPTGVPRCQITDPITTASIFMKYPFPAEHSPIINEQIRLPAGETVEPTTLPLNKFKFAWAAVVDRATERSRYDLLQAADGYTAELSNDASGAESGVEVLRNKPIPLIGEMDLHIRTNPVRYTINIKKDGTQVASCAINLRHTVSWIRVYAPPEGAERTGNAMFPYSVQSLLGTPYVNRPFPTPAEYSSPFKSFVGRFMDGSGIAGKFFDWTSTYGYWPGFMGPQQIEEVPENSEDGYLIMPVSASIWGYKKSTFISRVKEGPLLFFKGNTFRGRYDDALIPWDTVLQFDPTKSGLFLIYGEPFRLTVHGMATDDRGFIYNVNANGAGGVVVSKINNGKLEPQVQILSGEMADRAIEKGGVRVAKLDKDISNGAPSIYKSGYLYYMMVDDAGFVGCDNSSCYQDFTNVIDVTNPYAPMWYRTDYKTIKRGLQAKDVVAVNKSLAPRFGTAKGELVIYDVANYVTGIPAAGGASEKKFTLAQGAYAGLIADKASGRFMAASFDGTNTVLSIFSPGADGKAASYTETKQVLGAGNLGISEMDFNNGYLLAMYNLPGRATKGTDMKLWVLQNGVPSELDTHGFINKYYYQGWTDPVSGHPKGSYVRHLSMHTIGGKDYLFVSTDSYADIFELEPVSRDVTTPPPGANPPPAGQNPMGTSTIPIVSDNECLQQYQYLCDQISQLTKRICALVPSACSNGALNP